MSFPGKDSIYMRNDSHSIPGHKTSSQNKKEKGKPLQTQNDTLRGEKCCVERTGRTSVFTPAATGSFTVEASLVITLFLLSLYGILCFFTIFHLQIILQEAAEKVVQSAAQYGYVQEYCPRTILSDQEWMTEWADLFCGDLELEVISKAVIKEAGKEYLDHSCIIGGSDGICFSESHVMEDDGMIDLVLCYDVKIPAGFPGMTTFHFVQRSRVRSWIGSTESCSSSADDRKEDTVYITETGTVYHLYEDCTHIKLSIRQTSLDLVPGLRNDNGGKYKPCEKCWKKDSETVYITSDGDRYHSTLSCSGLKRKVTAVPLSEVDGKPVCIRCQQRKERE